MIVYAVLATLILPVVAGGPRLCAAPLMVGTARVEITPPVGTAMAGYGARKGVSTGIHDPLYATVLVLRAQRQSIALVTVDLVAAVSARLETEVQKRVGISDTLLSSSHTHSGPDTRITPTTSPALRRWWAQTEDKLIQAVIDANDNLFPARVGAGRGRAYVGHNRRQILPDGSVQMRWRNAEKAPTSPVDPTVSVLRIDDESGQPRVVLVNYSCHPTVLGPDNLQISGDYVAVMRDTVEKQLPGVTCLFVCGAIGDINPYFDKQPIDEKPFDAVRWTGETLGKAALAAARRIEPAPASASSLQYTAQVHTFSNRWKPDETVPIAMGVGLLNETIGFVTLSADPFVDHQIRLRDKSDCVTTFLFAHTSTKGVPYARYLPTIRAAVEGGYGAGYATLAEVGAGEMLIDRAVVRLLELMGELQPVPDLRY